MNKNESRYFNTAIFFDKALISLLEEKDIEYITIKELCNKASVNRSTFYLHYDNINDLVDETMDYINNEFLKYFNENTRDFINKMDEVSLDELKLVKNKYLTPYLTFVRENRKIFKTSFNNPSGMNAKDRYKNLRYYILDPILDRFNIANEERDYVLAFFVSGIMAIIKEWINNDCICSISYIEDVIIKCVGNF